MATTCGGMCVIITFSMLHVISFIWKKRGEKEKWESLQTQTVITAAQYIISQNGILYSFGGNITFASDRTP